MAKLTNQQKLAVLYRLKMRAFFIELQSDNTNDKINKIDLYDLFPKEMIDDVYVTTLAQTRRKNKTNTLVETNKHYGFHLKSVYNNCAHWDKLLKARKSLIAKLNREIKKNK